MCSSASLRYFLQYCTVLAAGVPISVQDVAIAAVSITRLRSKTAHNATRFVAIESYERSLVLFYLASDDI